jgi:hypothetical protein
MAGTSRSSLQVGHCDRRRQVVAVAGELPRHRLSIRKRRTHGAERHDWTSQEDPRQPIVTLFRAPVGTPLSPAPWSLTLSQTSASMSTALAERGDDGGFHGEAACVFKVRRSGGAGSGSQQ